MNDIYSIAAKIAVLYPCDTIRHIAGKISDIRAQSVGGLELEMQWSPGHRKNGSSGISVGHFRPPES